MAWLTHRRIGLTYRNEKSNGGYTLFSSVRGHHATILDSHGEIIHQWHHDEGIQHLKLLNNGHLLIHTLPPKEADGREKIGGSAGALIELNAAGETLWEHRDNSMHHDYIRLANGNTLYLAWEKLPAAVNDQVQGGHHHEEDPEVMWGDVVREIDPRGTVIKQWNSWEHLKFDQDIICPLESHKEWTHANSLEVLANGDWLISFRLINTVVIVDAISGAIKWKWGADNLSHQHNAQQLDNGNLLIFDNGCHRKRGPSFSRVIELDPDSKKYQWVYTAETILAFYSFMVSGCQRLPNGNTLITEGATGRIFEVTKANEVVWEYISPWTIPSVFGPTPAVFRAYRFNEQDHRLKHYQFTASNYTNLNAAIKNGEVQRETEYDHKIAKADIP